MPLLNFDRIRCVTGMLLSLWFTWLGRQKLWRMIGRNKDGVRTWHYLKKTKRQTTQSKHTQAPSFPVQCPTLIKPQACTRAGFSDTKGPAARWQHGSSWRPVLQGAVTSRLWDITHQHAGDSLCLLSWKGPLLVFKIWSQLFQGYVTVVRFLCLLCYGFFFFPPSGMFIESLTPSHPFSLSNSALFQILSYSVATEDKNVFRKRILSDGISSILKAWNSTKKMKSLSW